MVPENPAVVRFMHPRSLPTRTSAYVYFTRSRPTDLDFLQQWRPKTGVLQCSGRTATTSQGDTSRIFNFMAELREVETMMDGGVEK
jgi:hypothetical protein